MSFIFWNWFNVNVLGTGNYTSRGSELVEEVLEIVDGGKEK